MYPFIMGRGFGTEAGRLEAERRLPHAAEARQKAAPRLAGGARFEVLSLGLTAGPDEGELTLAFGFRRARRRWEKEGSDRRA